MISILKTIILIIFGVLIFELLIFSHEFGHFITAKLSGVKVNEFALGMGPKIFQFQKKETKYTLRLLPIGGYCAMEGEDTESDSPDAFGKKAAWKRMIIVCAGAVMNIIVGLILVFCIVVQNDFYMSTEIGGFYPGAYTEQSGLKVGDKIESINGYKVNCDRDISFSLAMLKHKEVDGTQVIIQKEKFGATLNSVYSILSVNKDKYGDNWNKITDIFEASIKVIYSANDNDTIVNEYNKAYQEMSEITYKDNTKPEMPKTNVSVVEKSPRFRTDVEVTRNGEKVLLKDVDFYTILNENNEPTLQFDFYVNKVDKTFLTVIDNTIDSSISIVRMIWQSLVGLVTGQFGMNDISGPVGAAQAVSTAASIGLETSFLEAINNIIFYMAVISINLGIFNMLPIPALDGGRFFFLLIEVIFRKPIPAKYEGLIHSIGFMILIAFILGVTINDIARLINGRGLF